MASKLLPANPSEVMVIRKLSENITTLSAPFARFGKIKFGGRATLVRLQTGGIAVFSPISLTDDVKATVTELGGRVDYLIAPDIEHHISLGPWAQFYKGAKVIGPEGLREKRAKQGNEDVQFDYVFTKEKKHTDSLPEELQREFEAEYFESHPNKELVFVHKPDKTLIQADLLFNLPAREQYSKTNENPATGAFTKIFSYFTNTHGKGQQRFAWYVGSAKDRPSFNRSIKTIAGWDFDRIVPCHGDTIETDGKTVFRRVFAWHL